MRRRAWLAVLGGGAVLIGIYYGLPEGLPRAIAYEGIEVAAALACLAGVLLHRPSLKLPWVLIALGLLAFAAGDVIWDVYDLVLGESPAVTPGDAFYLAAYPALFAAVGALVRRRDPARDRGAQVDTLVITLGAWVLVWQFLIVPAYEGDTPLLPALEQAVVLAYPMMDVLLLGFVARLAWAPGTRVPSYWFLLGGLLAMLTADIAFAWIAQGPGYEAGGLLDLVWFSSYLLLAASAAHRSMAILSEPAPRMETRIGAGRLALLGAAMLVVPAMVAFLDGRGRSADPRLIVLASAAIAGLVLVRLVWLVRDRERTREALRLSEERFRSLVQNASDAIAVFDPDTTFTFVSPAVERLLGYRPDSLVGSSCLELINPDDRTVFEDAVAEAFLNPARTIRVEIRLRHALGAWRWSEMLLSNRTTDPSVQGMVANVRDVTDQKEVELELSQAVLTDPLTGLPNRTLLVDRLGQTVARLERSASTAAVAFLDLDRFKVVNDSLGHEAGDRLLVAVADRLRSVLRPGDTVARFGGDEFVMICQDLADPRDAGTVADRVSQTLSGEPFVVGDDEVFLTASIGVVPVLEDGSTPMDLIRDADAAMYHAKERGRSRTVFFDPSMRAGTRERLEIESGLHRALEQNEFVLHYQPVVELATGRIVGFEALLRWQHPDRGLLPPLEFIGLAEESGLIVPIGQWALEEAASQVREWAEAHDRNGDGTLDVAVNLSAIQLRHGDLVERVAEVVRGSGIPARALMLEITESILMEDTESSIAVLRRLRDLGVVLAVDDFGTGYSSLSYLKRFPVDILKVDREFVDGLGESQEDSAIVEAVVSMGHILGLRVIAEGVETPQQLGRLRELGCDLAQGFLFAEPRPPERIAELLEGGGRIELPGTQEPLTPTAPAPDAAGPNGAARRASKRRSGSGGSARGGRKASAASARTTGGRARE